MEPFSFWFSIRFRWEVGNRGVFLSYRRTKCPGSQGISLLHFSGHYRIMQLGKSNVTTRDFYISRGTDLMKTKIILILALSILILKTNPAEGQESNEIDITIEFRMYIDASDRIGETTRRYFDGLIDEVGIYDRALINDDIEGTTMRRDLLSALKKNSLSPGEI